DRHAVGYCSFASRPRRRESSVTSGQRLETGHPVSSRFVVGTPGSTTAVPSTSELSFHRGRAPRRQLSRHKPIVEVAGPVAEVSAYTQGSRALPLVSPPIERRYGNPQVLSDFR